MARGVLALACAVGAYAFSLMACDASSAAVLSVTTFDPLTPAALIAPPLSAGDGALVGGAFVWEERNDYVLPVSLPVDVRGFGVGIPGRYQTTTYSDNPGFIPAGTTISSFILHFDTATNQTPGTAAFRVLTDEDIIGVIFRRETLDATDSVVGAATVYPLGLQYRGTAYDPLEGSDDVAVGVPGDLAAGFSRSITVFAMDVQGALDEVRIITATPVPEPSSVVLFTVGAIALGCGPVMRKGTCARLAIKKAIQQKA